MISQYAQFGGGYREPMPKLSIWDYAVAPIYPQFLSNKLFTITTYPDKGLIDSAKKAAIESGGDKAKYWRSFDTWESKNMNIVVDVPKIPGLPPFDIDWDLIKKYLLLGAVAVAGLWLAGKYIGRGK